MPIPKESWKIIKGFPDYFISNQGRLKSLKFNKEKIRKTFINQDGYIIISLFKNSKRYDRLVAKLVLCTFKRYSQKREYVFYKDKNKTNVRLDNLTWAKRKQPLNKENRNVEFANTL